MNIAENITAADIVERIRKNVAAQPWRIYYPPLEQEEFGDGEAVTSCQYVHYDAAGKPILGAGCMVGNAFLDLGIEPADIIENAEPARTLVELQINDSGTDLPWLSRAQLAQDTGHRADDAVAAADLWTKTRLERGRESADYAFTKFLQGKKVRRTL